MPGIERSPLYSVLQGSAHTGVNPGIVIAEGTSTKAEVAWPSGERRSSATVLAATGMPGQRFFVAQIIPLRTADRLFLQTFLETHGQPNDRSPAQLYYKGLFAPQ